MGIRSINGKIAAKSSNNAASSAPRLVFVAILKGAAIQKVDLGLFGQLPQFGRQG